MNHEIDSPASEIFWLRTHSLADLAFIGATSKRRRRAVMCHNGSEAENRNGKLDSASSYFAVDEIYDPVSRCGKIFVVSDHDHSEILVFP